METAWGSAAVWVSGARSVAQATQLGQAAQLPRRVQVPAADRERHLTNVDIAARIDSDAVRRDELAGSVALDGIAETRQELTVAVQDADAVAEPRRVVDTRDAGQLADVHVAVRTDGHAVWSMDVVPHRDERAVGVEHLDAVTLTVRHIDSVLIVDRDIVGSNELTGIDARLAPRADILPIRHELVNA